MHHVSFGAVHVAAFVLGATIGSFLNVVIHRVPRGESVVHPRSRCPSCGTPIAAWNNVPIVSWLVLRGRCASCNEPISPRYPLVELLTGMLWLAVAVRYGLTWAGLAGIVLVSGLVVVTFVDLDHWEIPDEVSLPGIVVGALIRPLAFDAPWWDGVVAAALSAGLLLAVRGAYMVWRGVEGMGLGDVKLIAMLTAFLGLDAILPIVLVSSLTGSIVGGVLLLWLRSPEPPATMPPASTALSNDAPLGDGGDDAGSDDDWTPPKNAVPFGPFLALAGLAELLLGPLLNLIRHPSLG